MDMQKLRGRMVEKGEIVQSLASLIGIEKATLYRRIKKSEDFTIHEAVEIARHPGLTAEAVLDIFLEIHVAYYATMKKEKPDDETDE